VDDRCVGDIGHRVRACSAAGPALDAAQASGIESAAP
jgi:hypothetical protein